MTKGDSGLRRAATGVLGGLFPTPLYHLGRLFQTRLYRLRPVGVRPVGVPSLRIQDFLSINDGQGKGETSPLLDSGINVIPAKAGIQKGGPGCQADGAGDACRDNPCIVIPARRECMK